jgi:ABC-type transport system substrate-binding protein
MRLAEQTARLAWLFTPGLLLAACTGQSDSTVEVAVIGQPASLFDNAPRQSVPARLLRNATAEGLVSLDAQGRAVPAVADRWIVTDDGLSYIFRLRSGTWPDGSPMTAESGRQALRDAIAAQHGTPMALDLSVIEDIRMMAGRVIEIRLSSPQPDFLMLLAQPELGLVRKGSGAGPMSLTDEKGAALLKPIPPDKLGLPSVEDWASRVRNVRLEALPVDKAIDRFAQGNADVVEGGSFANLPLVDAAGISRGALQIDPTNGLFGLAFANADGFLSQSANREAIAMAIDRDGVAGSIGVGGWQATTRVIPPNLEGNFPAPGERWANLSLAQRRDMAKARVQRWNAGESGALQLRIAVPDGPGADRLFAQLKADLASIGIGAARVAESTTADLRLIDTVAPIGRASWYFHQFHCSAQRNLCNSDADRQFAAAMEASDPATRARLLNQAEASLSAANIFVPLGQPVRWSLVGGTVTGFAPNWLAFHPLMPMALRPK